MSSNVWALHHMQGRWDVTKCNKGKPVSTITREVDNLYCIAQALVGENSCKKLTRASCKNDKWSNESLEKAKLSFENAITDEGMKLKVAARAFEIPSISLRDHLHGKTRSK